MSIQNTLGSVEWVRANEDKIKALLPDTWTHVHNLNVLQLGFEFKLLGIDWHSEDEFSRIMIYLEKLGILLRQEMTVRRNQHSIFTDA